MSDIVERVAIALYTADGFALAMWTPEKAWLHDREAVRERYRAKARVAMTAMREPTEAVINAIYWSRISDNDGAIKVWHDAIDAALK